MENNKVSVPHGKRLYKLNETVVCNGLTDEILSYVEKSDTENWNMGYRLILKEEGTQSFEAVKRLPNKL